MAGTLRAIVVGSSFGGRVHVPALRAAGIDIVGLVGRDPARTADRAAALGIDAHGTSITDVVTTAGTPLAAGAPATRPLPTAWPPNSSSMPFETRPPRAAE